MPHFHVTYEVITPESAEDGEAADRGFYQAGGWKTEDRPDPVTLREAIRAIGYCGSSRYGYGLEGSHGSYYTIDSDTDYRTGEETRYAIHGPRNMTRSSERRLTRLLTGRR